MQVEWLQREENSRLILVFMGWASGSEMINKDAFKGADVIVVFDYLDMDSGLLKNIDFSVYEECSLLAWSFGVWVADKLYSDGVLPQFKRAVAVNGTLMPVDDNFGIPLKSFNLTLRGLKRVGISPFYERICSDGNIKTLERDLNELYDELNALYQASLLPYKSSLEWSSAIVGERDLIFPPQNITRFWQKKGIFVASVEDMEHYPFTGKGVELINKLINGSK